MMGDGCSRASQPGQAYEARKGNVAGCLLFARLFLLCSATAAAAAAASRPLAADEKKRPLQSRRRAGSGRCAACLPPKGGANPCILLYSQGSFILLITARIMLTIPTFSCLGNHFQGQHQNLFYSVPQSYAFFPIFNLPKHNNFF